MMLMLLKIVMKTQHRPVKKLCLQSDASQNCHEDSAQACQEIMFTKLYEHHVPRPLAIMTYFEDFS